MTKIKKLEYDATDGRIPQETCLLPTEKTRRDGPREINMVDNLSELSMQTITCARK